MEDEWTRRARSFGRVAEIYDRWRPGYPDALFADVLGRAPAGRVLEAGAGTGRATLALARHGASVMAVEPDPAMAAVARERTAGLAVEIRESPFEDCIVPAGTFDLVVSAQAWHWVDPERGAAVAAGALRAGGALCLWWNRPGTLDGPVWAAVQQAYAEHAPALDHGAPAPRHPTAAGTLAPAPGFTPWSVQTYDWSASYDAEGYSGLVGTHSDHLLLPASQREQLLAAVRDAITDAGSGRLDHPYRTVLLTAEVQ
jgi:SAM-dependent methyltransferase